jgi:hypothetical protein
MDRAPALGRLVEVKALIATVLRAPAWTWGVVLAALTSIPALCVGFVGDDFIQRSMLEGERSEPTRWLELYSFTSPTAPMRELIEQGSWPWFTDPELEIRFPRPVSSASLALDVWLFGGNAVCAHVHSLLWLLLLTALSASLYQRWFAPSAARLSAAVFALAGAHAQPTAWLAARHTLIGATLGVGAVWAWVRYREDDWRVGRYLAPCGFVASLLASESALAAGVLLVGYELTRRGLRRGARGASPFIALAVLYLALYALLGFGTRGSGLYVSPFSAPARYVALGVSRVGVLLGELLVAAPADVVSYVDVARGPVIAAAVAAACAFGAVSSLSSQLTSVAREALAWLSAGTFVSLWALVGMEATGRVLPLPLLGSAAVVGNVAWLAWRAVRSATRARRAAGVLALVLVGTLHLGLSPAFRTIAALRLGAISVAQHDLAIEADVGACAGQGYVYLLTGGDPALALFSGPALEFHTPEKAGAERFRVLSLARQAQQLRRVSPNAFELELERSPRVSNPFEALLRSPEHPLTAGERVSLSEMTAVVEAPQGSGFSRARFEHHQGLDTGRVCLMAWRAGRLEAVPIPPLGESVLIAHEPGPMGL